MRPQTLVVPRILGTTPAVGVWRYAFQVSRFQGSLAGRHFTLVIMAGILAGASMYVGDHQAATPVAVVTKPLIAFWRT